MQHNLECVFSLIPSYLLFLKLQKEQIHFQCFQPLIQKCIPSYFLNFYAKAKRCIKSKSFNRILSTYKNCVTVTVTIELLGNFPSYIPTLKSWHCSCDTKLREKQIQTFLPIFMIYMFVDFLLKNSI